MFGRNAQVCWICGQAFLSGCVIKTTCTDCEINESYLIESGWVQIKGSYFDDIWKDPTYQDKTYSRQAALEIQRKRDIK